MSSNGGMMMPEKEVEKETFLGVMWASFAVSSVVLLLRLYVRFKAFGRLASDDYLVVLAWVIFLASSIMWQIKVDTLWLMYGIADGTAAFGPDTLDKFADFFPFVFVWSFLFYTSLWCVKFSCLAFFRKLGSKVGWHPIWWWVVFGITFASWIVCVANFDYKCSVGDFAKILTDCPNQSHIDFQARTFYANLALDIGTNILIMSIPVLILWNVQIPWRNKLALMGVFSTTVLCNVVAGIRVSLVEDARSKQLNFSIDWKYLWYNAEMGLAIIVGCVSSFRQLFVSQKSSSEDRSNQTSSRSKFSRWFGLGLSKFRSSPESNDSSQGKWWKRSDKSSSARTESQTDIVLPLDSLCVERTVDVTSITDSTKGESRGNQSREAHYAYASAKGV